MADIPVTIALAPDTERFAEMLRVFARHLLAAADEIADLSSPATPRKGG